MLEKIKSNTQISHLFQNGRRIHGPYVMLIATHDNKRHDQNGRVAFIAGKRFGNAVWRNSAKRRMRAICGECSCEWDGYDVLFVAKKNILQASYQSVRESVEKQIRQMTRQPRQKRESSRSR